MIRALHQTFGISTRDIPQRQRAEWFSHRYSSAFFPARLQSVDDYPFHVDMSLHSLCNINIGFNELSAHRGISTRAQTSNANDAVLLAFKSSGSPYRIDYDGERTIVWQGEGSLHRTSGAMDCGSQSPGTSTSVHVQLPPAIIRQIAPKFDLKGFRVMRDNPALRLLANYLGLLRAQQTEVMPDGVAQAMHDHILDLVALAIGTTRDMEHLAQGRGAIAARLKLAMEFIRDHLLDPGLCDEMVALHLGVSARYVRRLFEHVGTGGCAAYIKLQRLKKARQMLASPLHLHRKIIDIAFLCGFDDISTFNRRFRTTFEASPSDIRQIALRAAAAAKNAGGA